MNLFLWYPKCSTCQKAKKYLDDSNIKYELRDIVLNNPNKEELRVWIAESNLNIKKFFNTSGLKYKELKLKDKLENMTTEDKLDVLASDGMLVKRPLFIGKSIVPGFKNYDTLK